MPKYRKKPVVIEAEQWLGSFSSPDICDQGQHCESRAPHLPHIHTLEGEMRVNRGDWIITGIKGEKYPCKPDIFEATYERVEEAVFRG